MLGDRLIGRNQRREPVDSGLGHNDAIEWVAGPFLVERGLGYIREGRVADADGKLSFELPQDV